MQTYAILPKYKVSAILCKQWKKGWNGGKFQELLVRFVRYNSLYNDWLTCKQLKNALDLLCSWDMSHYTGPFQRSETPHRSPNGTSDDTCSFLSPFLMYVHSFIQKNHISLKNKNKKPFIKLGTVSE